MLDLSAFDANNLDQVLTPCLAVSPSVIRSNYQAMIAIAGSADRLRPHVKTHKCSQIVQIGASLGITKHKCATLAEAEMLAKISSDVLIAYPLVGPNIVKLAGLSAAYPHVQFSTLVDCISAAELVSQIFTTAGRTLDVLIDVNVGMNRTGIATGENAIELAKRIKALPSLNLVGLHVYDGHNHQPALAERLQAVEALMQPVVRMIGELKQLGIPVTKLVCGGTPTFPAFAHWANLPANKASVEAQELPPVELSPGTSVLSDYNYGRDFPDIQGIKPAAILLTRIVSKPGPGLVTVDLGHKAVAADQPAGRRCHFFDLPDAKELKHSEEHLVIETSMADSLQVGQVLRVQPAHICPTVALHENLVVIENGRAAELWPVTRHRIYFTS